MAKNAVNIKRYWLRRRGTLFVCQRTPQLAKRDDMIPITQEERDRIHAMKEEKQRQERFRRQAGLPLVRDEEVERQMLEQQVKEGLVPESALHEGEKQRDSRKGPTLAEMNEAELREAALNLKIVIPDDADAPALRKVIENALEATSGPRPPAEDEEPTEFAEETPDDLDEMNFRDLQKEAKSLGLNATGTVKELQIKIRQARKEADASE